MKTRDNIATRAVWFSLISNALMGIIKFVAGIFGNSFALIADATESLTDVLSSFLVLLGLRYSQRPPDENHPYGHGKAEPLVTFFVVAFLVGSAIFIAIRSLHNIRTPHELPEPWTIIVLLGIIFWKELSYRWIMRRGEQTNSSALKADAWHHRSDAITSVAALIGICVARILGSGYEAADDWAALMASLFILYNSYLIFRPALGEVMDEDLSDDLRENIKIAAAGVNGIVNTEKCLLRKSGMQYHLELHARVNGSISVERGHELAHDLQNHLKRQFDELGHITIHIEPASIN